VHDPVVLSANGGSAKGMYIRNSADIPPKRKDIRIADMNKLDEMCLSEIFI